MKLSLLTATALLFSTFFVGCGDNFNSDNFATKVYPTYPSTTGRFIDAGVEGLNYTIAIDESLITPDTAMNTTEAGGNFEYLYGEILLFKIGNLTLGKAVALSTITPKDIVSYENLELNTSIYAPEVNNRVRLLISLDTDNDPDNGITISPTMQEQAKSWDTHIDYSLSESAFTTALNAVTKGDIATVATKAEAEAHFAKSLRCVYSGAYRGSWLIEGKKEGFVGVMIQADGVIVALGDGQDINNDGNYSEVIYSKGIHNMDTGYYNFDSTYHFDTEAGRIVSSDLTDINGSGSSQGYNTVNGLFVQVVDGNTFEGSYTASRVGEGSDTSYRYTGYGYQNAQGIDAADVNDSILGLFSFDVRNDGNVTGLIHDARTNAEPSLTGNINFQTGEVKLDLNSGLGHTVSGNINFETNSSNVLLNWYDANGVILGYIQGIGCQLQPPLNN